MGAGWWLVVVYLTMMLSSPNVKYIANLYRYTYMWNLTMTMPTEKLMKAAQAQFPGLSAHLPNKKPYANQQWNRYFCLLVHLICLFCRTATNIILMKITFYLYFNSWFFLFVCYMLESGHGNGERMRRESEGCAVCICVNCVCVCQGLQMNR